jgi:predicted transcriptional regulator
MQHTIELDQQAEQRLSVIATDNQKSKDDILLLAIKGFLNQQSSKNDLEQFLKPYQLNMNGFKFERDSAKER